MDFMDVIILIYYILEIIAMLYTIWVCITTFVEHNLPARPIIADDVTVEVEVEEENILLYLLK
jgi:hypothetical protein